MPFRFALTSILLTLAAAAPAAAQWSDVDGEASIATEALTPDDWSTGMHRALLRAGSRFDRLSLFAGGMVWGQEFGRIAPGTDLFVASGVDRTFTLERSADAGGGTDSVEIAFPEFVEWDDASTNPFDRADSADVLLRATYALPTGDVGVRFEGARAQRMYRSLTQLYNPEGWRARYATDRELGMDGRVDALTLLGGPVTFQFDARARRSVDRGGIPDPDGITEQESGFLGFETSSIDFLVDGDDLETGEDLSEAIFFDAVPPEFFQMFPGQQQLATKQTYEGIAENLRINPYGVRTGLPLSGFFNTNAFDQIVESGTRIAASAEWRSPGGLGLRAGGDYGRDVIDRVSMTLYTGRGSVDHYEPARLGAFADAMIERPRFNASAGLRFDRIDTDGHYSRVPGFTGFVPDSLSGDRLVLDESGEVVRYEDQLVGGVARGPCNENFRTDGSTTCLDNRIEAGTKNMVGGHVNVSSWLTERSRVWLGISQQTLGPVAPAGGERDVPSSAWGRVLYANASRDFSTGLANTMSSFGRDVDMPRVRTLQAGVAYERGNGVLEIEAFHEETSDALTFRRVTYQNPVTGSQIFINSLVNRATDPIVGVVVNSEWAFGPGSRVAFGYTWRSIDDAVAATGPFALPVTDFGAPAVGPFNLTEPAVFPLGAWTEDGFGPGGLGALDAAREHLVEIETSFLDVTTTGLLADAGFDARFRFASGLPYTRLINQAGGQVGPPGDGSGDIAERFNSSRTPWISWMSLRAHKGVAVRGASVRAFVELTGALSENQSRVFLETGRATNDVYREAWMGEDLGDQNLDGDFNVDDFNIVAEFPGNDLNEYALLQAEDRFGNGDGTFTVAEQEAAFGAFYDLMNGPQLFERSDRSLRLGVEVLF